MDYTEEDLNQINRVDLELIARDIKSQIMPFFSKLRKYELIKFILTFQKFISDE
tara:strand:- start:738 stop:899 length:162 start_codon:yes stop_codon:yes gene_type:complete